MISCYCEPKAREVLSLSLFVAHCAMSGPWCHPFYAEFPKGMLAYRPGRHGRPALRFLLSSFRGLVIKFKTPGVLQSQKPFEAWCGRLVLRISLGSLGSKISVQAAREAARASADRSTEFCDASYVLQRSLPSCGMRCRVRSSSS